jgi:hypothetical protein
MHNNCHVILLKTDCRASMNVGLIVGITNVIINSWLDHYKVEGVKRLSIKTGLGRKPVVHRSDAESVHAHIAEHRQRSGTAHVEWQAATGKTGSRATFRRLIKVLADDTNT